MKQQCQLHEDEACDGILLVDANNAFNELNRATALWNAQIVCPPFSTVLINTYRGHARLFVAGGRELSSREGTTQGCPLAMPMYAVGVLPLISGSSGHCHQVWYADDATGSGRFPSLRAWWDAVVSNGPAFGYFPNASKTWLIVQEAKLPEASHEFEGTGVRITTSGQ